ncbi:MAG: hypothetical protein QOI55_60 [Actinomycetota bacterium]|nr:hypothetical protein [Actinomycetota bacterium]
MNRLADRYANTTVMPTAHAPAIQASAPGLFPLYKARVALVTTVNGFPSATGRYQPGIVFVDTNAEDTNVSGNIQMNPAEFAASTDFTDNPMSAWIQLNA